jgi:hypothetical protein
MSRNVSVLIGTYLLCTMSKQPVDVEAIRCSDSAKHPVSEDDKFCATCGAKTERTVRVENAYHSMNDVAGGDVILTQDDANWLFERFSPVWPADFLEEGQEIIMYDDGSTSVDADNDGMHDDFPPDKAPSLSEVYKMCEIMGYTNAVTKRGVIVINSY